MKTITIVCQTCSGEYTYAPKSYRPSVQRKYCNTCRYKLVAEKMKQLAATPEGHAKRVKAGSGNSGRPKLGNRDENHWAWKGDSVGYASLHNWVRRRLGKASKCEHCGVANAAAYDWSNISGDYKRDLSDWQQLCRACHQIYDDIKARSWATRKEKNHA